MPDIGWMELLVIGIVALIVVGPEDLPRMFQKLGQMVGRVRGMAREFTSAMNAAADETGMSDINRDLRSASKFTNPKAMAREMMSDVMGDIDPSKYEEGSATRIIAEKKKAAQDATREKVAAMRAARAAELSGEPEDERVIGADPGPAKVEAAAGAAGAARKAGAAGAAASTAPATPATAGTAAKAATATAKSAAQPKAASGPRAAKPAQAAKAADKPPAAEAANKPKPAKAAAKAPAAKAATKPPAAKAADKPKPAKAADKSPAAKPKAAPKTGAAKPKPKPKPASKAEPT